MALIIHPLNPDNPSGLVFSIPLERIDTLRHIATEIAKPRVEYDPDEVRYLKAVIAYQRSQAERITAILASAP